MTMTNFLTAATFLAVFCGIFGFNLLISDILERSRKRRLKELESQLFARQRDRARSQLDSIDSSGFGKLVAAAESDQLDEHRTLRQRLDGMLEQADMQISPSVIFATGLLLASLATGIVYAFTGNILFGLPAAAVCFAIPLLYVGYRRDRRTEAMRGQLPDSLELMSRVLRAGQTMTQAMQSVATEYPAPIATEFALCYEQQNLGLSAESALRDLSRRTGLLEIQIFVLALMVHRQTGGNLTELLDRLADLVRERYRLRGKIRAFTAEGRLQAVILLGLPVFMYIVLLVINRQYALELLDHPGLIAGMLGMMAIGALWIRRIINFDF